MPELLAPAGNREKLETAVLYGADAVYLGGPAMNLRAGSAGFCWEDLPGAISYAHNACVRVYFCLNALPRQHHMPLVADTLHRLADFARNCRPDALIIADPGVLSMARKLLPDMPVHLSTQANTANAQAASFWQGCGVTRVNLARELDYKEIKAVTKAVPDMEFESFVHGAMCMAISGRCLLSAYMTHHEKTKPTRSANLGECTHPCRYSYKVAAVELEEKSRPGEVSWEVMQTEDNFSHIMAAHDLCLIQYLPWLINMGIHTLKIEGRMKSGSYLAHTVDTYATAIKDWQKKQFNPHKYKKELLNTASRPLSTGLFLPKDCNTVLKPVQKQPVMAKVEKYINEDKYQISIKNKWEDKQDCEIMIPGLKRQAMNSKQYALEDNNGQKCTVLHPGTQGILRTDSPDIRNGFYIRQMLAH